MPSSRLHELSRLGQSVWIDYLSRDLLHTGELARIQCQEAVSPSVERDVAEPCCMAFELIGEKGTERPRTIEQRFVEIEEDGLDHGAVIAPTARSVSLASPGRTSQRTVATQ